MLRGLLLFLVLSIGTLVAPSITPQKALNHAAMHRVAISSISDESGYCTAEAIGPHAILTAAHCLAEADSKSSTITITVDVDTDHAVTAYAGEIIFDNNDHVIMELQHPNLSNGFSQFDVWINVAPEKPIQGEHAYFYGAPKAIACLDCYREGYVMGAFVNPRTQQPGIFYSMLTVPGDSGSSIFNDRDQLIGIVSIGMAGAMGAYDLKFPDKVWKAAVLY